MSSAEPSSPVSPRGEVTLSDGAPVVALYSTAESWRGAGVSYVHIARGLARHRLSPHMVATSEEVAGELERESMAVTRLPDQRLIQAFRLRRVLLDLGAQVLIIDRAHDLRVAARAVLGTRIGVINRYNLFRQGIPDDLMIRVAYRDAVKEVVFLSDIARNRVLASTPFMRSTSSSTIHEGVELEQFRPDPAAGSAFRKMFKIPGAFLLAVGALAVEKRYGFMFDALGLLDSEAPQLVICGEGEDEKRLRARAAAMRLNVHFLGRIPRDHLPGAYNASMGLIHTGAVETFGIGVLEAMACGRPIVASDGGAIPEVIGVDGSCGTLVDVDSVEETASAIRCLVTDPEGSEAAGVRGRERAKGFPVSSMEDAYARLALRHTRGTAT